MKDLIIPIVFLLIVFAGLMIYFHNKGQPALINQWVPPICEPVDEDVNDDRKTKKPYTV